jgi:hypothetical protein
MVPIDVLHKIRGSFSFLTFSLNFSRNAIAASLPKVSAKQEKYNLIIGVI